MTAPAAQPDESTVFQSTPFGKYTLLRKLGKGGMGIVYEGLDTVLNRRVAVKMLQPGGEGPDSEERERFLREARLSAALPKHPHIVSVYEAGVVGGRQFLAMEFIEGRQFGDWRRGREARDQVAALRDVAAAVHHAHEHGVVHRDLKPANILVDAKDRPHVMDFGLAKTQGAGVERTITTSGMVVGTPAYMSPEQAQGLKDVDGRSDVFSLGTMLFEILTGHLPFDAETAMQVLVAVIEHSPPLPTQLAASYGLPPVDPALEAICLTALAKSPEERYPTAKAFADALTLWLSRAPFVPVPPPSSVARRSRVLPAVFLVLLAGIIAAALVPSSPARTAPWPLIEHPGGKVMSVAFAPDGARLYSGGEDGVVRIWDLAARRQAGELEALGGKIESMALSPDGRRLAAVTEDRDDGDAAGEARIWELEGSKAEVPLEGHETGINAVAFSRDGARVATGDKRGVLRVWDAATGRLLFRKKAHEQPVRGIAFGPGGGLATASWDRTVRLWGADGAERGALKGFRQGIWGVAVSPDGAKVATADSDRQVRLWDLAAPGTGRLLGEHRKEAVCVAFSADGRRVASGGWDRAARVWDAAGGGGELAVFEGHADFIWGVAFSPDGRLLATAGLDGRIRLWLLNP